MTTMKTIECKKCRAEIEVSEESTRRLCPSCVRAAIEKNREAYADEERLKAPTIAGGCSDSCCWVTAVKIERTSNSNGRRCVTCDRSYSTMLRMAKYGDNSEIFCSHPCVQKFITINDHL